MANRPKRTIRTTLFLTGILTASIGLYGCGNSQQEVLRKDMEAHENELCIAHAMAYNPPSKALPAEEIARRALEYISQNGIPSRDQHIGVAYRKPGEVAPEAYSNEVVRDVEEGSKGLATIIVKNHDPKHCGGTTYQLAPKE